MSKQDKTYCHLCGAVEEAGGWCTNDTCAEAEALEIPDFEGTREELDNIIIREVK